MKKCQFMFWAKLRGAVWPEHYHPVLCHLVDVGQVARRLWTSVRPTARKRIRSQLGVPDDDAAGAWLAFWAACHDIGKLSPCFQHRGEATTRVLWERLKDCGFNFPGPSKPHGAISTHMLAKALKNTTDWPVVSDRTAHAIAIAVGGHHGTFPSDWSEMFDPVGNEAWFQARQIMLATLAALFGVTALPAPQVRDAGDQSIWMYLAGLTSVSDWIGSNEEFFDWVGNPQVADGEFDLVTYWDSANQKALRALDTLGWTDKAINNQQPTIHSLLPSEGKPRPLQAAVAEVVDRMDAPQLLIVEAPMGEGKTEAAWLVAATWDWLGGQGTYVALPTMATSNQMFERVERFLERLAGRSNLQLLHGKAALNEKFADLRYRAEIYDERDAAPSAVVAEGWFAANKKHGLLAPYGVGTIDQALLAVLQTKHVFVRLFGLASKCVILDEVHAYDAYMTTLMERLLRWLAALGCPVVLLSATLPKVKRLALIRAYAGEDTKEPDEKAYPRVTTVKVGGIPEVVPVDADRSRAKSIRLEWVKQVELATTLKQSLMSGGCAAVIRNTVSLAQETFLELSEAFREDVQAGELEVYLFHARFPFGRRKEIEDNVLRWFGRTDDDRLNGGRIVSAPHRPKKAILVATQVIEQSLDLDFDVMISDLAPVDLVLQRAGRLHRHDRNARPVEEPKLYLVRPGEKSGLPDFGISGVIYAPHVLFRSLLVLLFANDEPRLVLNLPFEIEELVDHVYGDKTAPDSLSFDKREFWESTRTKNREAIEKERAEAETRQIKMPKFRGNLARMVQEPREEDNPNLHPAHQALTRLARPTVSLICLIDNGDGVYRLPHDDSVMSTLAIRKMPLGGFEDVGRLMLGEVTVAHWGVISQLHETPRTPREWEYIGMLCRHHLILFTRGKAIVGEYEVSLDRNLGLTIRHTNGDGDDE